jgi:hypothetical protein
MIFSSVGQVFWGHPAWEASMGSQDTSPCLNWMFLGSMFDSNLFIVTDVIFVDI